jgi:hypothetical protein
VLEMLVALGIIAVVLIPVLNLVRAAASGVEHAAMHTDRTLARSDALRAIASVNPMIEPNGDMVLGGFSLTWRSHFLVPETANATPDDAPASFLFGLYRVDVTAFEADGREWFAFSVRQTGHRSITH